MFCIIFDFGFLEQTGCQLVKAPYVEDFGTAYLDAYEREHFNLNKMDDFGNTLLLIAAQNGNEKIAKLLVEKGANPNHQNRQGGELV